MSTEQQLVDHTEWIESQNERIPETVNGWELQTSHGSDYIQTEKSFMCDELVEWKLNCEYPYYLQMEVSNYGDETTYSLKIERPLGRTQLLDGPSVSLDLREALANARSIMKQVNADDIESPFYSGSWFPMVGE